MIDNFSEIFGNILGGGDGRISRVFDRVVNFFRPFTRIKNTINLIRLLYDLKKGDFETCSYGFRLDSIVNIFSEGSFCDLVHMKMNDDNKSHIIFECTVQIFRLSRSFYIDIKMDSFLEFLASAAENEEYDFSGVDFDLDKDLDELLDGEDQEVVLSCEQVGFIFEITNFDPIKKNK